MNPGKEFKIICPFCQHTYQAHISGLMCNVSQKRPVTGKRFCRNCLKYFYFSLYKNEIEFFTEKPGGENITDQEKSSDKKFQARCPDCQADHAVEFSEHQWKKRTKKIVIVRTTCPECQRIFYLQLEKDRITILTEYSRKSKPKGPVGPTGPRLPIKPHKIKIANFSVSNGPLELLDCISKEKYLKFFKDGEHPIPLSRQLNESELAEHRNPVCKRDDNCIDFANEENLKAFSCCRCLWFAAVKKLTVYKISAI